MVFSQGDVLKIEHVSYPIFVTSKKSFNGSGMIIGCPFVEDGEDFVTHIPISINDKKGFIYCEQLKLYDLKSRGHKRIYQLSQLDTMEIADTVQGLFDYIYP